MASTRIGARMMAAGLLLVSPGALADTQTGSLTVSAQVVDHCAVESGSLSFGSYDPVGVQSTEPKDATGTLTLSCTDGTQALVTMDDGRFASGGERRMAGPASHLAYAIFADPERSTPWGNEPGEAVAVTGTGAPQPLAVHGRIAAGQNVPAGDYADVVTVTVNF